MKKTILLFSALLIMCTTLVHAQNYLKPIQSDDTTHAAGLDTATNTNAVTKTVHVVGWYDAVVIQATVTKLTGTPGGKVDCYGSIDGVQYDYVNTSADTLAVSNVSTPQTHTWVIKPGLYQYYKLVYSPTGTQTSAILGKALLRRYDN